jgi:hypothetical protein
MTDVASQLRDVLAEALECMAFADVVPASGAPDWTQDDLVWSSIVLGGPVFGTLIVGAPGELVDALAMAAWGGEAEVADPGVVFVQELLNTAGGRFLVAADPTQDARLGLPVGGRGPHPEAASGESFLLEVDGVPFGVALLS